MIVFVCAVLSIKLFNNGFGDNCDGDHSFGFDDDDTIDTNWMECDENMNDIMPPPPPPIDIDIGPIQSQHVDSTQRSVDENEHTNAMGNENENDGNQDASSLLAELSSIPSTIASRQKKSIGKKRRPLMVDEQTKIPIKDIKNRLSK